MKLANDICRCHGVQCGKVGEFARYLLRKNVGPATPVATKLCEPGQESEHFILWRSDELQRA